MSRTFVALGLFFAASAGFATPAPAQYNAPNNQYDLQRGQGGYGLPRPAAQDTPQSLDILQQPPDILQRLERRDQPLNTYRIDQGCPSCR
jgi:hypothetical protein